MFPSEDKNLSELSCIFRSFWEENSSLETVCSEH